MEYLKVYTLYPCLFIQTHTKRKRETLTPHIERERGGETDPLTHTHTYRDRERECVCVCDRDPPDTHTEIARRGPL